MLKKQITAVIALFAAVFVCTEISAGLVDHGDMTGFPNVNVDAHFLRIAQKYLPETRQQLPTAPPKWRGDCWDEPIRKKAKGLNIPEEQLKAFVEYVKEPHHMYGLKRVPAPHPELYEFELYADGKRQISTRHYHREIPSAWKKLLELPVEQRRYTTIPVHYSFYIQREDKRQYLEETIAAALEALNSGCYDTQACLLALCRRDVILNEDLPQITAKSPIAERIFLARQDFRAFAVNMKPEKRWRWHNDMDIWVWHNCRGDHAYTGNMPDALYWLKTFENEDSLREIASKDPMLRDVIVAFGLTNLHVPVVRKVAREFARESEINHPVLALRLPYDEAKKLLEGKKEYAALLDLLTIKQLDGEDKIAAIDAYITKYPDYTEADMPKTSIALNTHLELNAFAGVELLKLGRYEAALKRLLNGSTPEDAGLIAEQIMTTEELLAFCRKYTKNVFNPSGFILSSHCINGEHPFDFRIVTSEHIHELVRNILARRLVRENRAAEAREWFTGDFISTHVASYYKLTDTLRNGKSDVEKLDAALDLAALMRHRGDLLCGTYLEPDNLICLGRYACVWGTNMKGLKLNKPDLPRYSYRYKAAEYYRLAATFTQNRTIQAACYWCAGTLLKNIAPEVADADFKKLAKIAPELIEKNWFKPYKKVSMELQGFYNREKFFYRIGGIQNWNPPMPMIPEENLPENDGKPETLFRMGREAYEKYWNGEKSPLSLAQIRYAFYLAGKGGDVRGYFWCGVVELYQMKEPQNALALYRAALALDPGNAKIKTDIGTVYLVMGYYQEFYDIYRWSAENPDSKDPEATGVAAFMLAMLHFEGKFGIPVDKEKARMYLKKAIDLGNPEAERMRFLLEDAPETKK